MDAVRRDDGVSLGGGAVGERHARHAVLLRKADAAVPGVHDLRGQRCGQERDEVGAVHSEGRVPARRVGHLHRRDRRAVVAEIARGAADAAAPSMHGRPELDALQLAHAVGRQEHAGPDLAERRRLFVDRDLEAVRDQGIGGEQAADAAAHDHHVESRPCHRHTVIHAPSASTDLNTASSAAAVCRMPAGEIGNAPCPSAALAK